MHAYIPCACCLSLYHVFLCACACVSDLRSCVNSIPSLTSVLGLSCQGRHTTQKMICPSLAFVKGGLQCHTTGCKTEVVGYTGHSARQNSGGKKNRSEHDLLRLQTGIQSNKRVNRKSPGKGCCCRCYDIICNQNPRKLCHGMDLPGEFAQIKLCSTLLNEMTAWSRRTGVWFLTVFTSTLVIHAKQLLSWFML